MSENPSVSLVTQGFLKGWDGYAHAFMSLPSWVIVGLNASSSIYGRWLCSHLGQWGVKTLLHLMGGSYRLLLGFVGQNACFPAANESLYFGATTTGLQIIVEIAFLHWVLEARFWSGTAIMDISIPVYALSAVSNTSWNTNSAHNHHFNGCKSYSQRMSVHFVVGPPSLSFLSWLRAPYSNSLGSTRLQFAELLILALISPFFVSKFCHCTSSASWLRLHRFPSHSFFTLLSFPILLENYGRTRFTGHDSKHLSPILM